MEGCFMFQWGFCFSDGGASFSGECPVEGHQFCGWIFKKNHKVGGVPPPGMIISDNGGDFNNSLFTNMAEMFNMKSTAAESPWSNDIVEQHNAILAKVKFKKLMKTPRVIIILHICTKNYDLMYRP